MKDWRFRLLAWLWEPWYQWQRWQAQRRLRNRTIRAYMHLPYTYEISGNPRDGWFVRVKELRGCMSQGDTPQQAWENIREAMQLWLEVALEDGIGIPLPQPEGGR